jgi:hypothetical protein
MPMNQQEATMLRFTLQPAIAIVVVCAVPCGKSLADEDAPTKPPAEFDIRDADGNVLIAADQIRSYDWATHTMHLAPGVREKLSDRLIKGSQSSGEEKLRLGAPFTVCVGGTTIYEGKIMSSFASSSRDTPVIVIDPVAPGDLFRGDSLRIQLGYPTQEFFKSDDPRADQRIDAALRAAGKLAATRDDHIRWVAASLMEMQTIKQGATREELLAVFVEEGGLSNRLHRRYAYRDCPYFKVDVTFNAADNTDEKIEESPDDKVSQISTPFLEWPIVD